MYTSPRNTKYEKPLFSGNRPLHKSLYIKLKHPSLPYYRSSLIRIKWSIKEHDIRYLTYWRTKNSCIGGGIHALYLYERASELYGFKAKSVYMPELYQNKK
jgi:hypothetical protein